MSFPTAYTPLESLLLFQALRSEGVNSHAVFNRISDQLKSIPLVRDHPSYDSGRLSPDALRELYLWLLKEEVKRDLQRQLERDDLLQNGNLSPASRKRKAPSPSLPTVHEASQHAHLIPQLVTRLYARYRDHAVRDMREQEQRYEALVREIDEIEAGKWDERLQRQSTASKTQSPRPVGAAKSQIPSSKTIEGAGEATGSPAVSQKTADDGVPLQAQPRRYTENKIDALINHEPEPQNGIDHRRQSSNTILPPLSEMAPQSPRLGIPSQIPPSIPTQTSGHAFNHSPTTNQQSPFPSHYGQQVPGGIASPQVQTSLSRPSSSPRPILPPPPGMKLPPPSPVQHSGSPGLYGSHMPSQSPYQVQPHSHHISTGPSPGGERGPQGYPPPHLQPQSSYHYQQPYSDRRTSFPPPQHQQMQAGYQTSAPYAGNYQMPPHATEPAEPIPMRNGNQQFMQQQQHQPRHSLPISHQRSQYQQHPPSAPSTSTRPGRRDDPKLVSDIVAALATPPRQQRAAVWKSERRPPPIDVPDAVPRPDPEPLSPVLTRHEQPSRATRASRTRAATTSEPSADPETLPVPPRGRGRPKRERSPVSVVSSTADESTRLTRSQSVSTATGAVPASDDHPGSRSKVKAEPSTPAGFVEDADTTHEIPSTGRMTRKRRGTLQTQLQPPQKRKRQLSIDAELEDTSTPPPRPTTVIANRNFNKLSAAIMNDINSHKNAFLFANPVRDRDAAGYSEIVKQPQSLKGIRAAIAAGAKAVNAAVAALDSPSAAAADGSTIELERSVDLIPPKAIVNPAQLHSQLALLCANAVMFNVGNGDMVTEAREFWEDIDAKLTEWRQQLEESGQGERDAGEMEAEDVGRAKRRKL